ncbi:MAG: hypothetical protein ACYS26_03130 [Planctomycetota bacterium]|jgi:hypothetical protein
MILSSLALAFTALGGVDDPNLPAAPVIDPVFLGEFGGYQDLELDKSVDGLEDGTVVFDTMVRLSAPIAPQDDDFAFVSRFRGEQYDFSTPWVHYGADAADIRVLSYDLTYLLARVQVEVPVGLLAGDHGMSAADWPIGYSDLQVAIGEAGSLGLDDAGDPKGADSMASLSVFGDYPDVFARVDGGESAVGIQDSILVMRHEDVGKPASYSLELFEEGETGLLAGTSVAVHFDALEYMFETEVLSLQEGSFRMRLLDSKGKVVFESEPVPVTGSDSFEYDSSMGMPNSGGAFVAGGAPGTSGLTLSGPGGSNELDPQPVDEEEVEVEFEIEEPPILLKLYSRCVQGSINDNGNSHSANCGDCSTAQNPPEPNCVEGDSLIFYTSAYCKSRPWYLTTCVSDGFEEKQGPTYRFVGKSKPTTQGCTQVSVGISAKISEIFGGSVSVSKPRRRICCEYERNENETGKVNMRKCRHS